MSAKIFTPVFTQQVYDFLDGKLESFVVPNESFDDWDCDSTGWLYRESIPVLFSDENTIEEKDPSEDIFEEKDRSQYMKQKNDRLWKIKKTERHQIRDKKQKHIKREFGLEITKTKHSEKKQNRAKITG